jgi:RNA polymerase sigma factor (sigma-70 family)
MDLSGDTENLVCEPGAKAAFCTTHWTVVLAAARPGADGGQQAFAQLYRDYWSPLYAYVRRRGFAPAEAEDIAQNFFIRLLEKHSLSTLEREGGRFRSFLLSCLENYLANEWDRVHARKRGGGQPLLSLNAEETEARFALEKADQQTPESLFEQRWVFTLLEHVMARLRGECIAGGKASFFDEIHLHLQGDHQGPPYADIASRHAMSEGAVKVAVHRLRRRYGQLLRDEIARTVSSPKEVDEELRHLIAVVGR